MFMENIASCAELCQQIEIEYRDKHENDHSDLDICSRQN